MDLYEEIVRLRREGRRAALATIVRRLGSTPRKDNAKMLIADDGTANGSVGGGCVEAEVWSKAQTVIESGRPEFVVYEMTDEDARDEGLVCGGTVEIFIEPVLPDPRLVIMGAGHVGQAIAEVCHPLGFRITVLDDRESFACSDRFPMAEQVLVDDFESGLSRAEINDNTFVFVVTRGHSFDEVALETAIQTPARYVGLIGSRRKIKLIVDSLLDRGLDPSLFERLYAPIGVPIGSETPEEIAVSVAAELIALRKGVHRRSSKQRFILDRVLKQPSRG